MSEAQVASVVVSVLVIALTAVAVALFRRIYRREPKPKKPDYDLWLTVFTGVTAVIGLIQIVFLFSADDTARRAANAAALSASVARDTLVATQRPWLSIDFTLTGAGLVYDDSGNGHVDVDFVVTNTGLSPGLNAHIDAKFVPFMTAAGRTGTDELRDTCGTAKIAPRGNGLLGQTIFPQQPHSEVLDLLIPKTQFQAAMEPLIPANEAATYIATLIGCLSYHSSLDDRWHITPFYAEMRQLNPANPKVPNSIEWSRGDQPVSSLVLQRSFVSLSAD